MAAACPDPSMEGLVWSSSHAIGKIGFGDLNLAARSLRAVLPFAEGVLR